MSREREALISCAVLNRMLEIGRPVLYQVRKISCQTAHCILCLIHAQTLVKDSLYVEKVQSGQDGSGPVTLDRKAN